MFLTTSHTSNLSSWWRIRLISEFSVAFGQQWSSSAENNELQQALVTRPTPLRAPNVTFKHFQGGSNSPWIAQIYSFFLFFYTKGLQAEPHFMDEPLLHGLRAQWDQCWLCWSCESGSTPGWGAGPWKRDIGTWLSPVINTLHSECLLKMHIRGSWH